MSDFSIYFISLADRDCVIALRAKEKKLNTRKTHRKGKKEGRKTDATAGKISFAEDRTAYNQLEKGKT